MKYFNSHKGYALFLTLLIIVIVSIMFISLVSLVQSGAKRTTTREHYTQATELSEKGLQHILSEIEYELRVALGLEGLSHTDFVNTLESILDNYTCDNNKNIKRLDLETGSYDICISNFQNVIDESGEENDLRKRVTFQSIGEADQQTKTVEYVMDIGADTVPDALKYALSTVEPKGNNQKGDGNIYLHGGLEIYGDIKVGNHLFTHDHGPGLSSGYANWRLTTFPSLYPSTGNGNAKIVLGGGLYRFNDKFYKIDESPSGNNYTRQTKESFYNGHLDWNRSQYYRNSTIEEMFANKENLPRLVSRDWSGNEVNINQRIEEAKLNITPARTIDGSSSWWEVTTYYSNIDDDKELKFSGYTNKEFQENNKFIAGKIDNQSNVKFRKGNYQFDSMYIKGNLTIGNGSTSNYRKDYDNVTIEGYTKDRGAQLFVDGNVTIQGANLKSNVTIYTTGTVTIRHTTIEGKTFSNNREGSLIVFSKGKVHLANNSRYLNEASELKGFFYSEDVLEMFGVGSNIKVHGGIAARRITLNAIRGNYNGGNSWGNVVNPRSINSPSRLVIQYDTELIENFLKLNPPEPVIREVDPSELIDRK